MSTGRLNAVRRGSTDIQAEPHGSTGDLLGHPFDLDASGCLDRPEAAAFAEDLRLQLVPDEMQPFGRCARSVGLLLPGDGAVSGCIESDGLRELRVCLVGSVRL